MYWEDYLWFLGAMLVCVIFSAIASSAVNRAYKKYGNIPNFAGMTGYDTARRLLSANLVSDISVGRVTGSLTDHYDPRHKVVNLSDATCDVNSIGAVAVAAHEIGHVMQNKNNYFLYKIRSFLVPVVNVGSRLAMPLVLVGLLIDLLVTSLDGNVGFIIAMVGVGLYGGALLFALVTLPVEINASRRASKMLVENGILTQEELPGAKKVLSAAAMTYLASVLVSLVYFLRFLLYVLAIFGKRNRN